jgi:hypothetical protein
MTATSGLYGAAQLARWGHEGTYFIPGGEIVRLQAEGHEIACHAFSHLDCVHACASAVEIDVDLISHGLEASDTFAIPFGNLSFGTEAALASLFALLRGVHPGLVTHGTDLDQARAVGIEDDRARRLAPLPGRR